MELGLEQVEELLELPKGFFDLLVKDDDWSFIIKLHAFLEAHISMVLNSHLSKFDLLDMITHIPMSETKYGKAKLAYELEIIPKKMVTYIRALSELRNLLAHNVKNVTFNIKQHYDNMNKEQRTSFYKKIRLCFARGRIYR